MTLRVADAVVTAGGTIVGHVEPSGSPVTIGLVQIEQAGEVTRRSKITSVVSERETGAFELMVPRLAHPTVEGKHVKVSWKLESDRHPSTRIEVQRDPQAAFASFYLTGEAPQVRAELSHRVHETIYMGGIMSVVMVVGFFYIEQASRAASTLGRAAALGILFFFALACLALLFLAVGTRWPRTMSGFEPVLTPDVVERGGVVELTTSQRLPEDLRLLCIESYGEVVESVSATVEGGGSYKVPVMRQYTHPPIWPVPSSSGCAFQLPNDALPSVRCAAGDVMWVVRQGGKTLGRWGPFRYRDWGVVVR